MARLMTPKFRLFQDENTSTTSNDITDLSDIRPLSQRRLKFNGDERQNTEQNEVEERSRGRQAIKKCRSYSSCPQSSPVLHPIDPSCEFQHVVSSSSSERIIMQSLEEMSENDSLIGDGTKTCSLPSFEGRHKGLRYISHQTLADLKQRKYSDNIEDYLIIDCRYPYEYNGGHIKDAVNYNTQEMINELFRSYSENKKTVLIFHCEFSSERGPALLRFLRNKDRELNAENYPKLCYPEIYLLSGGYKEFFENQKEYCFPENYVPMLNKENSSDLRHFRSKSKSWNGFERRKCIRF